MHGWSKMSEPARRCARQFDIKAIGVVMLDVQDVFGTDEYTKAYKTWNTYNTGIKQSRQEELWASQSYRSYT